VPSITKRLIFQVKTHRRWGKHPSTPKKKDCHIIVTPVTSTVSNFGDHVPPVRLVPGQALSVRRQRNRHVQALRVRDEVRPTGRGSATIKALDELLRFQGL